MGFPPHAETVPIKSLYGQRVTWLSPPCAYIRIALTLGNIFVPLLLFQKRASSAFHSIIPAAEKGIQITTHGVHIKGEKTSVLKIS